jgi:hypothetical protein
MVSILALQPKGNGRVTSVCKLQLPDHSGICEHKTPHLHRPLTSTRRLLSSLCISLRVVVPFGTLQRVPNHTHLPRACRALITTGRSGMVLSRCVLRATKSSLLLYCRQRKVPLAAPACDCVPEDVQQQRRVNSIAFHTEEINNDGTTHLHAA